MKFLLDTHIWIRLLRSPETLNRAVRRQIENQKNELYLSPISIWEAHLLERKGKLHLRPTFSAWLEDALAKVPVREAPFNFAIAAEVSRIDLPQSDLGDVFLAATASVFDLTLITADRQLIECSWLKTLANE